MHRVRHPKVLAHGARVWGRHRRDKEPVGVCRGSWGGVPSVGRGRLGAFGVAQMGAEIIPIDVANVPTPPDATPAEQLGGENMPRTK